MGSAVPEIALGLVRHLAFPDIVPLLYSDPPQPTWRFAIADIVTTLAWLAADMVIFYDQRIARNHRSSTYRPGASPSNASFASVIS